MTSNEVLMKTNIPEVLQLAIEKKILFFAGENCEWKFELTDPIEIINKLAGAPVLVFANNGYGDYLFLRESKGSYEDSVYEYFHEEQKIYLVPEALDTLLGVKERYPTHDRYPKAIYESGEEVLLGDEVQTKTLLLFWRGWQDGVIDYVPGVSNKKNELEHGGLKWISIKIKDGAIDPLVLPDTGVVKNVRLIRRMQG
jgi:hypothetical protein